MKTNLRGMTEKELREFDCPWPESIEELNEIITALVERKHTYGICVYAMSIAATATFYYVSHVLGVTGFQASMADMDIIRRTRSMKHGFSIIDWANLLYPQYVDKFEKPYDQWLLDHAKWLVPAAKELLKKEGDACGGVKAHWERLTALPIPIEKKNDK